MRINKLSVLALSVLGLGATGLAQAEYVGASSDTSKVVVGTSTVSAGTVHTAGKAGIAVQATGLTSLVDFGGLAKYVAADSNGVRTLNYATSSTTNHSNLGLFNFAQVGSSDIWFGEWSQTTSASAGDHTVYYVGDNTGTTIPTSGTATYTVAGISDYSSNGILSGSFGANFSAGTLSGTLSNASGGYVLSINSSINASNASFSGTAVAVAAGTVASGSAAGNFYGASAASLAGIATFSNNQYNAAYGGTKN